MGALGRRGHSYTIDGSKVASVTSLLGDGYPKPALINWAAETTAGYAVDFWDELAELTVSERLKRLTRARWDVQREAAVKGTQVHELAQRLSRGEALDVPERLLPHVDSYLDFAAAWEPEELIVERPVFSRRFKYAGTPDLFARLRDGKIWLLDWKTGAKGVFLDHVLQLAAYRYAEVALVDDEEVPVPEVDHVGIVWLRADGWDLVPIEAGEAAFTVFLYVAAVARFATGERDAWIGDALLPAEVAHE